MKAYKGSFRMSLAIYPVSRKNGIGLEPLAQSGEWTRQEDREPGVIWFEEEACAPMVLVGTRHGNGGGREIVAATPLGWERIRAAGGEGKALAEHWGRLQEEWKAARLARLREEGAGNE